MVLAFDLMQDKLQKLIKELDMLNKMMMSTVVFGTLSCSVHAATLDDVVNAFALPANSTTAVQSWATLDAMTGVHWKAKSASIDPMTGKPYPDSFDRKGQVELTTAIKKHPHISFTALASGDKNNITSFVLETKGSLNKTADGSPSVDIATMTQFFGKTIDVKATRPSCNSNDNFTYWDLYTITTPNKKPLFVSIANFYGGDASAKPTTTFTFQNKPFGDDELGCKATN